jgi:hypothetical protein
MYDPALADLPEGAPSPSGIVVPFLTTRLGGELVDPHGNIYRSAEPSPEDKARFDGYLRAKAEEGERRRAIAALGDYQAEDERLAGISAESPSQSDHEPPPGSPGSFGYGMYDPALADLPEGAPSPLGIAGADIPELLDKIEAETGTEPDWQALAEELAGVLRRYHEGQAGHKLLARVAVRVRDDEVDAEAALARYHAAIAQHGESPE